MSSFRRAVGATSAAAPSGTRRWLDGSLLVSSGLASLDVALGGGIPLGSLVILEEDASDGRIARTLASLFCAEAIASDHTLCVASADGRSRGGARGLLDALPFCASSGSADSRARAAVGDVTRLRAADDGDGASAPSPLPELSAGGDDKFCHTFDLSRRITPALLSDRESRGRVVALTSGVADECRPTAAAELLRAQCAALVGGASRADALSISAAAASAAARDAAASTRECPYAYLWAALEPRLKPASAPGDLTRVALLGLGGAAWPACGGGDAARGAVLADERDFSAAMPLLGFVAKVAAALGDARAQAPRVIPPVVLLVVPTWAMPSAVAAALRARSSIVLKAHAHADPAFCVEAGRGRGAAAALPNAPAREFAATTGFVLLRALPRAGHAAPPHVPDAPLLLATLERARLRLEPPHVPPVDAAPDQNDPTATAAALACAPTRGATSLAW